MVGLCQERVLDGPLALLPCKLEERFRCMGSQRRATSAAVETAGVWLGLGLISYSKEGMGGGNSMLRNTVGQGEGRCHKSQGVWLPTSQRNLKIPWHYN